MSHSHLSSFPLLRLCLLTAFVLSACTLGPDFVPPAAPDNGAYAKKNLAEPTASANGQAQHFLVGSAVARDWWSLFGSPALDSAVRQAVSNNYTLQAAEASLRQSQDFLRAGNGVFYPQVEANASASRLRTSSAQQGLPSSGTVFNVFTLSGSISYALDVFGGERRAVESLAAQVEFQRFEKEAAYLALTANLVNTCIARAAYQAQMRAIEQLIAIQEQQLRTTEAQFRSGLVPYANVLSIRALIAANRALLATLRQKVDQSEDLLASLEGVVPAKAYLPEIELEALSLPGDLPISLPSQLVRQRPDILSAEARLHAASAEIGVATAALFPSITLSGTYGVTARSFAHLPDASGKFWSIGPAVNLPLFTGGRLWFERQAAIDAYQQALADYRQTVLSAFAQVSDSLKALATDAEALRAQADARQASAEALKLIQANYQAGLVTYLEVLVADTQFHNATISYLQSVAQRQQDTVALFAALGGGWQTDAGATGGKAAP